MSMINIIKNGIKHIHLLMFIIISAGIIFCSHLFNEPEMDFYIEGEVFEIYNDQKIPVKGIKIFLNNHERQSTSSDGEGHFSFRNISPGTCHIIIQDSSFQSIDKTFSVLGNPFVSLELIRVDYTDYFPLKLDNTWTYLYTYQFFSVDYCVGSSIKIIEATKTWNVSQIISDSEYQITEFTKGVNLDPQFNNIGCVIRYDTVSVFEKDSVFVLLQQKNGRITALAPSDLLHGVDFLRYQFPCTEDTLQMRGKSNPGGYGIPEITELVKIVKDIGIVYYHKTIGGSSHHFYFETYELLKTDIR